MTRTRLRLVGLLIVWALLTTGCSFLQLPYFLMGRESKLDAQFFQLAEGKEEIKVVILALAPQAVNPDLIHIDRELARKVNIHLKRLAEENEEKIKLVPTRKVDEFKDEHPDWYSMSMQKLGEHFEADYVVYIELSGISLYEKGAGMRMYRGRCDTRVEVHDVNDEDAEPLSNPKSFEYPPNSRGAVPGDEAHVAEFRNAFLEHVARQLAYMFTAHTTDEDHRMR